MPQNAGNKKRMKQQGNVKGTNQNDMHDMNEMNDTSRTSNQGRKTASGGTKETNKQGNKKGK